MKLLKIKICFYFMLLIFITGYKSLYSADAYLSGGYLTFNNDINGIKSLYYSSLYFNTGVFNKISADFSYENYIFVDNSVQSEYSASLSYKHEFFSGTNIFLTTTGRFNTASITGLPLTLGIGFVSPLSWNFKNSLSYDYYLNSVQEKLNIGFYILSGILSVYTEGNFRTQLFREKIVTSVGRFNSKEDYSYKFLFSYGQSIWTYWKYFYLGGEFWLGTRSYELSNEGFVYYPYNGEANYGYKLGSGIFFDKWSVGLNYNSTSISTTLGESTISGYNFYLNYKF